MRNKTVWSNNDVKNPTTFTVTTKSTSPWANNDVKIPSAFVTLTKSLDSWGINFQTPQTYFYNDSNMIYNDPFVEYNYLLNSNQINQRLISRWAQVV